MSVNKKYINTAAILSTSCLLSFCTAIMLSKNNFLMASVLAAAPVLALFTFSIAARPYWCLILISISYMLQIQFEQFGLTTNIFFVAICIFSILSGKESLKFQIEKKFLFFLYAFIAYALFSYFFVHQQISYYDVNLYVNNIIILLLMFLLNTHYKIDLFYKAIVFSGLILLCSGLYQIVHHGGIPGSYMTGYFSNHVVYALHIAWSLPLSFHLYRQNNSKFYLFSFALLCTGLLLAYSRGVIMAVLLAGIAYMCIQFIEKTSHKKTLYGVLVILCFTGATLSYAHIINKGHYGTGLSDFTSNRSVLYQAAWGAIKDKPIIGIGWESYKYKWMEYVYVAAPRYGISFTDINLNTHSSYLKILSELGIIGIILFLSFNFFLLKDGWAILVSKQGFPILMLLLIYYFHGFVDNNSYGNDRMFYFAAGILFSLKALKDSSLKN